MRKKLKPPRRPCLSSEGKRHHISVPSQTAQRLHYYLRDKGIHSSPPEPSYTGVDRIELACDVNIFALRTLLKEWA